MFPTHVRFAGFAISYNISTSLFGGTAPAFNSWKIRITGDPLMPAYSMMGACVIGAVALRFIKETAGLFLRGPDIQHKTTRKRQLGGGRRSSRKGIRM